MTSIQRVLFKCMMLALCLTMISAAAACKDKTSTSSAPSSTDSAAELTELIKIAQGVTYKETFVQEVWENFQSVLKEAETLAANKKATSKDMKSMFDKLMAAYTKLGVADSSAGESSGEEILKPGGGSSVGAASAPSASVSSGPKQEINDDLKIDTAQEEKFKSLKDTTIRIAATAEELQEGSASKEFYKYLQKKYGVKFEYITLSWQEAISQMGQMVAAGNPPDSVFITENEFLRWTYSNVLQPIDKFIVSDPGWSNLSLNYFKTNNKVYAIPTGTPDVTLMVYLVYFNKTLFQEQKVKDPYEHYKAGTWTWAEFLNTARKMTLFREDGKTVKTMGAACWNPNVFVMANGGKGMVESKAGVFESTYSQPADMAGLQFVYDLSQLASIAVDPYSGFGNRSLAMHIERPGNAVGQFDYYNTMDDQIGMAPLPAAANGKYYAPIACYGNAVPRGAKNALGGVMLAYENLKQEARQFNDPSAYDLAERKKKISDEHLKILQDYLKTATLQGSFIEGLSGWQDDTNYGKQFWSKITTEKVTPAAAVDSMNGILKNAIKRTTGN